MSISQEIERIRTAKSDIINALQECGITVPADTMADALADYIAKLNSVGKDENGYYIGDDAAGYVLMSDGNGIYAIEI